MNKIPRFFAEYAAFKRRYFSNSKIINPGICAEIIRRIDRLMNNYQRGILSIDEAMKCLADDCMSYEEDMGRYMV